MLSQVSILFITPLAAIPILQVQLTPKELVTGTFIFLQLGLFSPIILMLGVSGSGLHIYGTRLLL